MRASLACRLSISAAQDCLQKTINLKKLEFPLGKKINIFHNKVQRPWALIYAFFPLKKLEVDGAQNGGFYLGNIPNSHVSPLFPFPSKVL